jgi:hypothetical protein
MTIYVGTNMEKKVSMTEMVTKDFMKLVPVAMRKHLLVMRKHPLAMRNYVMMM